MFNTDAYADHHLTCCAHNHLLIVVVPGCQAVVTIRIAARYNSRGRHWCCNALYLSDIAYGTLCDWAKCNLYSAQQWLGLVFFISLAYVYVIEQVPSIHPSLPAPTQVNHQQQVDPTGSECGGSDAKHCVVLADGLSTKLHVGSSSR